MRDIGYKMDSLTLEQLRELPIGTKIRLVLTDNRTCSEFQMHAKAEPFILQGWLNNEKTRIKLWTNVGNREWTHGASFANKTDFYSIVSIKCVYCGNPTESTEKYEVCTECYRVQE